MKKFFVAASIAVLGLGFTACSSDDDNSGVETNALVGEWKAETLSYVRPDNGETMTHNFSMITGGCDVDDLELSADNVADLERESGEGCLETHTPGAWDDTSVTIEGEENPREIISVSATELVLKYNMTWGYGTTDVTVTYTKS